MEELIKPRNFTSPDQELVIKKKQQEEFKMVGKIRRRPGLKLFSFNMVTKEFQEVQQEKRVSIGFDGKPVYETRVSHDKDCIYGQSLNLENFKKKIAKFYPKLYTHGN